jgi:hypothetical protein
VKWLMATCGSPAKSIVVVGKPNGASAGFGSSRPDCTRSSTSKPTEFLLAHRHRRHGASPATPEPAGVSPLSCRGVSSLYCGYTRRPHNMVYVKSAARDEMPSSGIHSSIYGAANSSNSSRVLQKLFSRKLGVSSHDMGGTSQYFFPSLLIQK